MSGRNHSEDTKQKISDTAKKMDNPGRFKTGHNHSEETKTKISEALAGKPKPKPEGSGRASQAIEVTDITNNTTISYDSISEAVRALNIPSHKVIVNYIKNNQQKPYKGIYIFKKVD